MQTTVASLLSHMSSHTVPHVALMHTSTLPSYWVVPPTSRTSPYKQADEGCRYKIILCRYMLGYLWGVTYYHCQAHPIFLYPILPNLSQPQTQAHGIYYKKSWSMPYYFRCRQEVPKRGGANQWSQKASVYASTRQDKQQTASLSHCMRKAKKLEYWCMHCMGGCIRFLKYWHMLTTALKSHHWQSRMLWLCQACRQQQGEAEQSQAGITNEGRHIYYYIIHIVYVTLQHIFKWFI